MERSAATIGLVAIVAGLWAIYGLAEDYQVFGGVSTSAALLGAAWLSTALLLVISVGRFVFGVGFTLMDREATGLQRGMIYGVLTFVAVAAIMASLGMNVSAILTTSVVASAIVGLAMQPTLGGLIAGSALHLDRVLHVGDVILMNQERIHVVSMNWRAIIGRKHGNTIVVIPNARIAENNLDILRGNQPARMEVMIPAPLTVPPHQIGEILSDAVYSLSYVDPALPVRVAPFAYQAVEGYITYRMRYWVKHTYDLSQARAVLLSRVWYVFQREGIPWPVSSYFADAIGPVRLPATDRLKGLHLDRLADAKISGLQAIAFEQGLLPDQRQHASDPSKSVIADCGPSLCYSDGELLRVPHRVEGYSLFLLVDGKVRNAPANANWREETAPNVDADRRMVIERIAFHLAQHIGPYAEYAVRKAAAVDTNPVTLSETVANEIEDADARQSFLNGLGLEDEEGYRAGYIFGLQSGGPSSRLSSPPLRAVGWAVIVPIVLENVLPGIAERGQPAKQSGKTAELRLKAT